MERPHKRLRIDRIYPFVPPEDGTSPFFEASHDMTELIFQTLSVLGEKEKMRLELVCQKFRSQISERSSWKGENKVELSTDEEHILINGNKFKFQKAATALSKLLDHITLERFILNDMSSDEMSPDVGLALFNTISQHKRFVNLLRSIKFASFDEDFDYGPVLVALAGCGLEQVTEIECGDWDNNNDESDIKFFPHSFFSLLSHCCNLKELIMSIGLILPIWEMLLSALVNCHHLTQFDIRSQEENLTRHNLMELGQFCSTNFPKLTSLRFFYNVVPAFEPLEFLNSLSEQIRLKIVQFGFTLNAKTPLHRECLKQICNWFSKLQVLNICSYGAFPTETIMELIGNIFSNYGRHERTEMYDFDLHITAENRGETLYELLQKRWNFGEELVRIEGGEGIWMCFKDNVDIRLELSIPDPLDH